MSIEQRKQQMQDILKDTVDYYRKDPVGRRAVDINGDCLYTTEDGKHCAIGRYMREEFLDTEWKENNGVGVNGLSSNVDYYLRHDVRGLDEDFWRDLQDMHDIVGHWYRGDRLTEPVNGLSDIGKARYVDIQDKIARGEYDD
jgi:hypothetical protein